MCCSSFISQCYSWWQGYSEIENKNEVTLASRIRTPEFKNHNDTPSAPITGIQFNQLYNGRNFIKPHYDSDHPGPKSAPHFTPFIKDQHNGFYFTDQANISIIGNDPTVTHIWTVTIPPDAELIIDYNIIKASKINLSNKRSINDELHIITNTIIDEEYINPNIRPFLDLFTFLSSSFPQKHDLIKQTVTQIKHRLCPNASNQEKQEKLIDKFKEYMTNTDPNSYCIFKLIQTIQQHQDRQIFTMHSNNDMCRDWIMFIDFYLYLFPNLKFILVTTLVLHLIKTQPHMFTVHNINNSYNCSCVLCKTDEQIYESIMAVHPGIPMPPYLHVVINIRSYVNLIEEMKKKMLLVEAE